jgi:Leucine-rich repeat (LRR) protein
MKSFKIAVVIALISMFILSYKSTLHAGDLLTDSLALVALYDSTNGDGWANNTGWKTDTVGAWYGIELENGRIVNIYLQGNDLNGNIPPAIGDLDSLKRLYLNGNSGLTDSLPPEIGNLSKLERLYIYSCNLKGSIPVEIGNLANIREIALDRNSLTGSIPSTLGNLSNLSYLSLFSNELSGKIPSELGDAYSLRYLQLDNNNLTDTIPSSLGKLSSLNILRLYSNELSGSIPMQLFSIYSLDFLNLSYNQLTGGIPPEIESLFNLTVLDLSHNPLGGTIPTELGNMTSLQYLYAGNCELTGSIPVELTNLNDLRTLELQFNQLTDSISSQFGSMPELQILNVYSNQLSGDIPPALGNLSNLQQLSLSSNNFTGTIPPELGNLSDLVYFELYGNELTGSIPTELGNLTNLWSFLVSENQLTGSIPPELGNLSNLTRLFIQNNELSGPVPEELTSLPELSRIHIRNNNLEDLPDFSGLASVIEQFHVENNKFTFGDLEPNFHLLDSYSPQDTIGTTDTIYFAVEDTLLLVTQTDGLYNKYQWTFDGGDISDNGLYAGTNDSVLYVMNPAITNEGNYACKVTNDTVTGLTIHRHSIVLEPTVKVTSLPETGQCVNDSIIVGYKSIEVSSGNIFTVELSDSSGSFDSPLSIGNVSSTDSIGTIKVHIPEDMSSGDQYHVRVNASNPAITGISSEASLLILNQELSTPVVTPSGDTSICEGESLELITDELAGLQYIWYKNDVVIDGATSHSYTAYEEGTYHVKTYNLCSTDSLPSSMVNLAVNPLPVIDLSLDGTLLTATFDSDYSYVWYLDGDDLLLNDDVYEYTALENGEYRVIVTDEKGCSATSNSQTVSITSIIDNTISSINIYPNPAGDKVNVKSGKDLAVKRIIIANVTGEIVYDHEYNLEIAGDNIEIDISGQIPGVYIVQIKSVEGTIYLKLVKQGSD